MEINKNFEYFDQTSNEIKKIIKKKIGTDYIKDRLKDFDFGFVRKSKQVQIGKIKLKKKNEILNSFVIRKLLPNPLFKNIDVMLVCSRINSKDDKQLLELVEKKASEINFQCLSLINSILIPSAM